MVETPAVLTVARLQDLVALDADLRDLDLLQQSAAANWGQGDSKHRRDLARRWTVVDLTAADGPARIPRAALEGDPLERLAAAERWVAEHPDGPPADP